MPYHKSNETRERRIWGDLADVPHSTTGGKTHFDYDVEIQEMSPPPSGSRQQTYPLQPDDLSGQEDSSVLLMQNALELPRNPNLTPRRRPRGPDVGKSIHKAAEASQATSSQFAVPQQRDRRRSVGRIVPSVMSKDDTGRTPKNLAITLARKALGDPHSASQWKLETQLESDEASLGLAGGPALGATNQESDLLSEDGSFALSRKCGSGYGTMDQRPLRSLSPSGTSTGYQVQLARKSASRKAVSKREGIFRGRSSLPPQRIRAARKTQYTDHGTSGSGSSGDSDSGGSEDGSNSEEEVPHSSSSSSRHLSEDGSSVRQLSPLHYGRGAPVSRLGARSTRNLSLSPDVNLPDPPQDLLSAFESISAYTVHLQTSKSLPFLLRNVRAGFQYWCQRLRVGPNCDSPLQSHHRDVDLKFEYTDSSGDLHAYNTETHKWECPLCSIFGLFSSCEALKIHVQWDHEEVEFEARKGENTPYEVESIIIKMKVHCVPQIDVMSHRVNPIEQEREDAFEDTKSPIPQVVPLSTDAYHKSMGQSNQAPQTGLELLSSAAQENSAAVATSPSIGSQSQSRPESSMVNSQQPTTSNETSDSRQPATPLQGIVPEIENPRSPSPRRSSVIRSIPMSQPPLDGELTETQSAPPPPSSDPHGPSLPVVLPSGYPPPNLTQPITYRPTGPHLYDQLASLPLDIFGPRSWFVLDKEEEIFELTDVLDEDKVMCALWARWIILNRSFFISNYPLGVEAFVEEYWLMIHQAAGWGALRTWLLVLVSRRFLKNIEMVRILKQYNGLVGKSRWPKEVHAQ